jgi:hypothetical protein
MRYTYEQNRWLKSLPQELADHYRRLLEEDGSYSLVSRDNGKTFFLCVSPQNSSPDEEE